MKKEEDMKRKDFLKAFSDLSSEDQAAIREELGLDPMAMCKTMMQKIQGGGDPMAVCKDMIEEMRSKCCCTPE